MSPRVPCRGRRRRRWPIVSTLPTRLSRSTAHAAWKACRERARHAAAALVAPHPARVSAADGEDIWFVNALGPAEKNTMTFDCGPSRLINGHYSVPVEWLNLDELTDEYAIFSLWPTEQNRIATTHLMDMPDLKWEKVVGDKYYMPRAQYDACNDQL